MDTMSAADRVLANPHSSAKARSLAEQFSHRPEAPPAPVRHVRGGPECPAPSAPCAACDQQEITDRMVAAFPPDPRPPAVRRMTIWSRPLGEVLHERTMARSERAPVPGEYVILGDLYYRIIRVQRQHGGGYRIEVAGARVRDPRKQHQGLAAHTLSRKRAR